MGIAEEFKKLIEARKAWQGDIDYERNSIIQSMIELFTKNVDETVQFIKHECSDDQMIWLSEILDEIIEITKSREVIEACYFVVEKFPETAKEYNIKFFVDSAAEYLD